MTPTMINIQSCIKCSKLFDDVIGLGICPECRHSNEIVLNDSQSRSNSKKRLQTNLKTRENDEQKKYEELKDYVLHHSRATIMEISTVLKINPSLILNWIREERLEFSDESRESWFECEKCGTKIKSGRYCITCKMMK